MFFEIEFHNLVSLGPELSIVANAGEICLWPEHRPMQAKPAPACMYPGCGVQLVKLVSFLAFTQGLDLVKRFRRSQRSWLPTVLFPIMRAASSLVQHCLGA